VPKASLTIDRANQKVYVSMPTGDWNEMGGHELKFTNEGGDTIMFQANEAGASVICRDMPNDRVHVYVADSAGFLAVNPQLKEGYYAVTPRPLGGWRAVWSRPCKRYTRGAAKKPESFLVLSEDLELPFPVTARARVVAGILKLHAELGT